MSNKYTSLTMNILVDEESITVCYNKEFMFPLMVFMPSLLAMILYLYTLPELLKWVLIFFFAALLSGLVAHLRNFIKGEDVFLWRVDHSGFFFQANRTNFFTLKPPVFYSWSKIKQILYVEKYTTLDQESDRVTIKKVLLLFSTESAQPKTLECPHRKKVGFELFNAMNALSSKGTAFEFLEKYDDSK